MSEPSYTLAAPCSHQADIRKSRFLAQAAPVSSADEALDFVRKVGDPGANHDCWAYRIGQDYRFNDDGEPSGSAGKPILAAIDGQNLDGVVAVVTRWFGGIKLGVGGLIRAYGGTAAECLRQGERIAIIPTTELVLECGYADLPLIKARLQPMQADIRSENFDAHGVRVLLSLPDKHVEALQQLVADITRGQGRLAAKPG
ncbi:MAG TPA: YigZ family protein [Rhodanobacteraceae bacterium]|nr:YigZ family protein [Rhodanobacteraceae bacterium]